MNNKKLVGDLRVLKDVNGGAMIVVGNITMYESQMTGEPIASSHFALKEWPEDWPDIKGLNEMWAGQKEDKELVLTMLNECVVMDDELVLELKCNIDSQCPKGMVCVKGECV